MTIRHPWWCGQAHHCTASRSGQHRSAPLSIRTAGAVITVTRTRTTAGRNGIEFRTHITLDSAEATASRQARHLAAHILTATTRKDPS